jgi:hypothetical protein
VHKVNLTSKERGQANRIRESRMGRTDLVDSGLLASKLLKSLEVGDREVADADGLDLALLEDLLKLLPGVLCDTGTGARLASPPNETWDGCGDIPKDQLSLRSRDPSGLVGSLGWLPLGFSEIGQCLQVNRKSRRSACLITKHSQRTKGDEHEVEVEVANVECFESLVESGLCLRVVGGGELRGDEELLSRHLQVRRERYRTQGQRRPRDLGEGLKR